MTGQSEAVLIYTTFPDTEEAQSAARKVVGEKLAACANILPGMISVYEWEGKLAEDNEVVAVFKTCRERCDALMARIEELHSYTVPAVLVLEVDKVSSPYMEWMKKQVS